MGSRKPWLNYHKPGAPVREYHEPRKKVRELFWARFWLVFYSFFGIHRFYLGQTKAGILWLVVGLPYSFLLAFSGTMILESADNQWMSVIPFLIWMCAIVLEYKRLPKLVRAANKKIFGRRVLHDVRLQGEIGPYGAMRPIISALAISYLCAFIIDLNWPNSAIAVLAVLLIFIMFVVAIIQYSKIRKIRDEDFKNDRP